MNSHAVILLVEDNLADVELTRESLRTSRIANELHVTTDGEQALAFLRREGVHADAPLPDVVLLDLNLPRVDGRQVLAAMRDDPALRRIPVCVLSSSEAEADILKSYDLGANCYLTKPVDLVQFERMVRTLEDFWFSLVRLPSR